MNHKLQRIVLLLCAFVILFSCQNSSSGESKKEDALVQSICTCSDALYQFNVQAQKDLPEAPKEKRAEILRNAENQMNVLEQCIIKVMGKNQIGKGEIDIQLIQDKLLKTCTNKPQTFLKRMLQDIQEIF